VVLVALVVEDAGAAGDRFYARAGQRRDAAAHCISSCGRVRRRSTCWSFMAGWLPRGTRG